MNRSNRLDVRQGIFVVIAALTAGMAFGCGGGGGDDGGNVLPGTCVSYAAAQPPASSSRVTTTPGAAACSTIEVRVLVENVDNVFGAGFDVVYDPDVVRFTAIDFRSSFLSSGGSAITCDGADPGNLGRVTAGCTILGASSSGVDFPADPQELVRLRFEKRAQTGSSGFAFENEFLADDTYDPTNPGVGIIPGVEWGGGTFTVR